MRTHTSPRTDIDDLPANIQDELHYALKIIKRSKMPVVMVWLFGSYSRGDFINRRNVDEHGVISVYNSDLDLLLVVEKEGINYKSIRSLYRSLRDTPYIQTDPHLVFESTEQFDQALREGDFFYVDVIKEGRLLWDGGHPLVETVDLQPRLRRRKAEAYFRDWYRLATGLKNGAEYHYQTGEYPLTLLNLHQMAEHLLHALHLVWSNYKIRTHELEKLTREATAFYSPILQWIDHATLEEVELFQLLEEAYVGVRYKPESFLVSQQQAEALLEKVGSLQRTIYHACLEKLNEFYPEQTGNELPSTAFLDLEHLKTHTLPHAELTLKKKALEHATQQIKEVARLGAVKERELEAALAREEAERQAKEHAFQEKEAALKREEKALRRELKTRKEKEEERLAKEQALQEKERLEALLRERGIDL